MFDTKHVFTWSRCKTGIGKLHLALNVRRECGLVTKQFELVDMKGKHIARNWMCSRRKLSNNHNHPSHFPPASDFYIPSVVSFGSLSLSLARPTRESMLRHRHLNRNTNSPFIKSSIFYILMIRIRKIHWHYLNHLGSSSCVFWECNLCVLPLKPNLVLLRPFYPCLIVFFSLSLSPLATSFYMDKKNPSPAFLSASFRILSRTRINVYWRIVIPEFL